MAEKQTKKVPGFRVIAKRDGFRRAGRAWHGETEVAASELTNKQIQQLDEENGRMLVVQETQVDAPSEEEPAAK